MALVGSRPCVLLQPCARSSQRGSSLVCARRPLLAQRLQGARMGARPWVRNGRRRRAMWPPHPLPGLIHRDLKPDNFLMGLGPKAGVVHLIDYGLATTWMDRKAGCHVQFREGRGRVGTAWYSSRHASCGARQSRRDDLESLGYVLLHFMRGSLPWQHATLFCHTDEERCRAARTPAGTHVGGGGCLARGFRPPIGGDHRTWCECADTLVPLFCSTQVHLRPTSDAGVPCNMKLKCRRTQAVLKTSGVARSTTSRLIASGHRGLGLHMSLAYSKDREPCEPHLRSSGCATPPCKAPSVEEDVALKEFGSGGG